MVTMILDGSVPEQVNSAREKLLTGHDPEETGVWRFYACNQSVGLEANHTAAQPHFHLIAEVNGCYGEIVEQALATPEFFTLGSCGWIEKVGRTSPHAKA